MDTIYIKTQDLMEKALVAFKKDLNSVSTGRATPNLIDAVRVDNYGNFVPISQVASVSIPDPATISIQPWDKNLTKLIEKAIIEANLGFNPQSDGYNIRINVPKLSEERRKELVKIIKKYAEDKKISVRNDRRDALDEVKKQKETLSEDEVKRFSDKIQKLTDDYTSKIDNLAGEKEKDIMQV
ncbi:MAG: ribosome recycling factor [Rickettsiales bacterium]|jgi:ribosome recycling factor|nr:ribosome recycling factor [Rickettsiales bacterium]